MAIAFSCPQCKKSYQVDESLAGRRVKCKGCGAAIQIPASAAGALDDDPYGLNDAEPDHAEAAPMPLSRGGARRSSAGSSGVPPWVWVASGGAGVVVLALLIALMIPRKPSAQAVAASDPAAPAAIEEPAPEEKAATPDEGFQRDDTPADTGASVWRVKPDPLPAPLEFPPIARMAIPISDVFGNDYMFFPTTPSPFVMLGDNGNEDHYREVWDLRTVKRVGRLGGRIDTNGLKALSPDGAYFVVHTNPVPRYTDIWDVAEGKRIARIKDEDKLPDLVDFAGPGEGKIILGTSYASFLQVWDFLKGRKLATIQTPSAFQLESLAFSPGRRYLALSLAQKNKIQVYDLSTGGLAGERVMEKEGGGHYDCEGMAFSPDGTALAGLFGGRSRAFLKCWDVATGKLVNDFAHDGPDSYGKSEANHSQPIQWLPDQSGWLIYDQNIVERQSGQVVFSIPFDQKNFQERSPRKLLDLGRVVTMSFNNGKRAVRLATLPKEKIQTAMAIAHGGGSAIDALLPPVKAADLGGAKAVTQPDGPVAWTALATSTATPSAKASGKSIAMKPSSGDILGILVSNPGDPPVALVVSSPGGRLAADKGKPSQEPRKVDRLDLAAGRPLGRFEIPSVSMPIAFAPGAAQILMTHSGAADRIDLHAADGGKHVVGWRPYEKESGDDRAVAWADFLDAKRVLTVNAAGTLILWTVPECKAVYVCERAMDGVPILGPDRKALAMLRGDALRVIDPATGEPKGDSEKISHEGKEGLKAAAFDPSGQELAAQLGGTLVRWDLKTGKIVGEVPSPAPKAATLRYGGSHHVLVDGKILVDLERGRAVWYYEGGVHARGGPGNLDRYASGEIIGPTALKTIEVPEAKVARAEAVAADPKTRAIFREGTAVSLQVVGQPAREADEFREAVVKGLAAKLKDVGVEVADDQGVKVVATFRDRETGKTMQLRKMGKNAETRMIPIRELEWELSATDGKGAPVVIAREKVPFMSLGFFERMPPGEADWEGYLRARQFFNGAAEMVKHGVPFFVARGGDGGAILPGWSFLGHPTL